MIKFITTFLLFNGSAWSQESEPSTKSIVQENDRKHNWSLGILDDKTGISLVGYTYKFRQTDYDELLLAAVQRYSHTQQPQDGSIIIRNLNFPFLLFCAGNM